MHREDQHMLVLREAKQLRAKKRPVLKIERSRGFGLRDPADFGGLRIGGERVEFDEGQCDLQLRRDALNGLTILLHERSTQAFVTLQEGIQSSFERPNIERPAQAHGYRNIIGGLSGVELFEEPQAFLRERQR